MDSILISGENRRCFPLLRDIAIRTALQKKRNDVCRRVPIICKMNRSPGMFERIVRNNVGSMLIHCDGQRRLVGQDLFATERLWIRFQPIC